VQTWQLLKVVLETKKKKKFRDKRVHCTIKVETIEGMVEACVVMDSTELC
jgi:hypothetical protein